MFLTADFGEDGTMAEVEQLARLFEDDAWLASGRSFARSLGGATQSKPTVFAVVSASPTATGEPGPACPTAPR